MLDFNCDILCVVLELRHDSSYLVIESYDDYIDDVIVVYRVTYR